MDDYLIRGSLSELDPQVGELTDIEAERQFRRLILIPSESTSPLAVRQVLASAFTNIYAEGYPRAESRLLSESEILNYEMRLGKYRRYSDPRYYKGVEYADIAEELARRRCAELFAHNGFSPEDLYVNVQPLSGAPANNAIYLALVQPGETVMGMDLLHGGHLTHGSPVNRSGKLFNIVHYGVDPETERIDYNAIETLAHEHQPKIIIAGYSSYPWSVDWARFRKIADDVDAYLLADIAHVAGSVVAGLYPSPVGYADVISFTTHKSLCGPRGAVIITTSKDLARRIDRAVFPGEQGGPHMNTILAQAVAFRFAATDEFKELQKQIVSNCQAMVAALQEQGMRIPFGGTDTHLANLDCSTIIGDDGTALSGDQAARILDVVGVVVNRNTIPGDRSAASPSGIRFGTPWITQRGFKEKQCKELAILIANTLKYCKPYSMAGRKAPLRRVKIGFAELNASRMKVGKMAMNAGLDFEPTEHGYPHFYSLGDAAPSEPITRIEIRGEHAQALLRWLTDARPEEIEIDQVTDIAIHSPLAEGSGVLVRDEEHSWSLFIDSSNAIEFATWMRDLSDGYVQVGADDLHIKIPGPFSVRVVGGVEAAPSASTVTDGSDKPWYLGINTPSHPALPDFEWNESEEQEFRRTALFDVHQSIGAKIIPFAGWEMPVWYSSVLEEHQATRQAAGLFDVSHMGVYQVEGNQACVFLDSVVTNDVSTLQVGESLYSQFLDPMGEVIDDTMIYRRADQAYLVVVNASNDDKDWAWLNAVREGEVCVDRARPWTLAFGRGCILRNLRDPNEGKDMRVDIAIQGPQSRKILLALGSDEDTESQLMQLKWAGVMQGEFAGINLIVSRTGYTGERIAYELFVHPTESVELWQKLMQVGEPFGLKPVGLGARDSLRTEAGLPLYGQEMAGELNLGVGDAGFAAYVKSYKPWFVGRNAFLQQEVDRKSEVTRFRFDDRGVRMAHYGDPVVDRRGKVIGIVTSCAVDRDGFLLGQVYLDKKSLEPGTPIGVFQSAAKKAQVAPMDLKIGDRTTVPAPATVLPRFP